MYQNFSGGTGELGIGNRHLNRSSELIGAAIQPQTPPGVRPLDFAEPVKDTSPDVLLIVSFRVIRTEGFDCLPDVIDVILRKPHEDNIVILAYCNQNYLRPATTIGGLSLVISVS